MPANFKYWAFISYSHSDKSWGDWLHSALETYRVPKPLVGARTQRDEPVPSRVFPIFRDREELPTSADLGSVISRALEQSRYLVVICSPRAAQSRWVSQEILDFKRLGREDRILALIVDGEPNAAEGKLGFPAEQECFPEPLKHRLGTDGNLDTTQRTEPIAADARPGKDGKPDARLKLLAGILGVNYDDLKRRDEHRRQQRNRLIVAVSTALILVFASLAAAALWQWRQAVTQTKVAQVQTREAEKQREEALNQKREADTQKAIAEQQTREAISAKERVEAQTADDEEELGRKALLAGDQLTAAKHLRFAYAIRPDNPAVRLMLRAAMSDLDGLSQVLRAGSGEIWRLEVSPSGGRVLTVSSDGSARVWDTQTGSLVAFLGKSGDSFNRIYTATFAPDGKRILFVNESEAFLQDIASLHRVPLVAHNPAEKLSTGRLSLDGATVAGTAWVYTGNILTTDLLKFSSDDGRQLSSAIIPGGYTLVSLVAAGKVAILIGGPATAPAQNVERNVLLVETQTGRIVARVPIALNASVVTNPSGTLFMICDLPNDSTPPAIYSAETGAEVAKLSAGNVVPWRGFWTSSGRYLLSKGRLGGTLWDASTWKPIHSWPDLTGDATIDPGESLLAAITGPGEISVWDLHSGKLLKKFRDRIGWTEGRTFPTGIDPLRFSADGRYLLFAGSGAVVTIWDWQRVHPSQPILSGHTATVHSIAFNGKGNRAVTGSADGSAIVWNAETGSSEFRLADPASKDADVPMAEFTPDATRIVTAGKFQGAKLWQASGGRLLRELDFDKHAIVILDIVRIAVGRQRERAVTFGSNGWGALWDLKAQKQIKSLHIGEREQVRDVSFARDGSEFIVAGDKGLAYVFDSLRGELKRTLGKSGAPLLTAEISPSGDRALTLDDNGQITVSSMADGRAAVNLNAGADSPRLNDAHFSPDGSQIIAACADDKVRVWNARTGQTLLTVTEETSPGDLPTLGPLADLVTGDTIRPGMPFARYSPDAAFFAGVGQSGKILVWDAKTGRQLLRLEGHTGRVTSLTFSSDGSRLGSSSDDNTARIWDLTLERRSPAEIERRISRLAAPAVP